MGSGHAARVSMGKVKPNMNANRDVELEQDPDRPRADVRRDFMKKLAAPARQRS